MQELPMYAYRDNAHNPNIVKAAYGNDENGPEACAPICGGSVKARSHTRDFYAVRAWQAGGAQRRSRMGSAPFLRGRLFLKGHRMARVLFVH